MNILFIMFNYTVHTGNGKTFFRNKKFMSDEVLQQQIVKHFLLEHFIKNISTNKQVIIKIVIPTYTQIYVASQKYVAKQVLVSTLLKF